MATETMPGTSPEFVSLPAPESEHVAAAARFPVVGIGASAGGLEAYRQLLQELPADTGMAFVLVQHLNPEQPSLLPEILSRATSMPVVEVNNEPKIEPNHVYVIPPNRTMLLKDGHLTLVPRTKVEGQHRSVDSFLRSLADDHSHHAVGVILSGTGTDGTLGLEAIKAQGGITFAQDQTAQHDGMPSSAVESGCVDFVLPPSGIAAELVRIARHPCFAPAERATSAPAAETVVEKDLAPILRLLHAATGVDFTFYKSTTLDRRITRRMLLRNVDGLDAYRRILQQDDRELYALYQDILISVTSFFRDPECFDTLRSHILPKIVSGRRQDDPLRFWVLGCSTGEEAYSLAITVAEYAAEHSMRIPVQVFATDLNEQGVAKARAGIYPKTIAHDVSPERLQRFFVEKDGGYQVVTGIREMCVFARQNVLTDPPFSRMDFVSCRNLLIYMEPVLQKRVIPVFHFALKPGGFLWLGSSESLAGFENLFETIDRKQKFFRKAPGTATSAPAMTAPWSVRELPVRPVRPPEGSPGVDVLREADRIAVQRYAPPGVLVNPEFEVQQFRGDTSPYLVHAPGRPTTSVLKMAREGLLVGLRSALEDAAKSGASARQKGLRVNSNGTQRVVDLHVLPVQGEAGTRPSFLVLFEEDGHARSLQPPPEPAALPAARREEAGEEVARLTRELAATREYMQALLEQKDAANEEMQSANEEIQSANEELQSVNEELQTSKEEIQSTNEELSTVNDELRHRNEELDQAHNDIRNFLAGSQVPMVMVGTDLRIRRFSPAGEKHFRLLAADVGRSIESIRFPIDIPDLEDRLREVMASGELHEREAQDRQGHWYSLRLLPYRTSDGAIEGVVVLLIDIEEQKRAQMRIAAAEERYRLLVDGATGIAMTLLDTEGRVSGWNAGAQRMFGYSEPDIEGQHFSRFFVPEDVGSGRPERELEEARRGTPSVNERWLQKQDGSRFWASSVTTALFDDDGNVRAYSRIVRDISKARTAEELLKESERRYRHLIQALPAAVYTCDAAGNVVLYNNAAVALWGAEPGSGEASWVTSARVLHPDGEPVPPELVPMARALRERRSIRGEKILVERPDRTRVPVLPFVDPIIDSQERVQGAICMLMDLSEISSAEAALQESESRLQLALSAAQMGTWFWRPNEDRHVLDPSLHQLVGFPRDHPVRSLGDFLSAVHVDDRPMVQRAFERAAGERGELDVQFRVVWPDGTVRWLRDRGKFVSGPLGGSPRLTGACVDVTDRVVAERALVEASRKKDEFLATLAHELRNPLAPIVNTLELLRLSDMDPQMASRGWDVVARQVHTLTRLVDDILDVARLSRGHIELRRDVVDFKVVVERAYESVKQSITGPGYHMSLSIPPEPVWMEADAVRLEQVVTNLLNNAIKYTDPGGHIDVLLEVEGRNDGGPAEAVLHVRDTGIGIAKELRSRIFDYFSRGDLSYSRHRSGLGIGLSLVKTLVEMHAGSVEVNSKGPSKGSEFVVRLPMRPSPPLERGTDETGLEEQPSSTSLRVLVVDDNVDAAQTLAMLLRRSGYEVHVANSGPTALEMAERIRPAVILMDIGMPGMDGFEVASKLRSRREFADTTLIALSGYGSEEDRRRSVEAGFDAHIVKPADFALITTLLTMVKPTEAPAPDPA